MPRRNSFSRLRALNIAAALHLTLEEYPQPAGPPKVMIGHHIFHGWNEALAELEAMQLRFGKIGD